MLPVALHGSLETFSLPDVLTLLATTGKKGELRVSDEQRSGQLWVEGGKITGASSGSAFAAVDVLFELLRLRSGQFDFEADADPADPVDPVSLDEVLAEAQLRLGEWRAIEAVVPSLDATVDLTDVSDGGGVQMSAQQWRTVVAVARAATVHGVMERLGAGEFDACRAVKDLVDQGLAVVGTAPTLDDLVPAPPNAKAVDDEDLVSIPQRKRKAKAETAKASSDHPRELDPEEAAELVKQLASMTGDEAEAQRAVEAYEKGELDGDDPIDRGLLLKFLSSVRT